MKQRFLRASAAIVVAGALSSFVSGYSDTDFMMKASQANIAEVEAAKLAVTKGSSAMVKTFARQMISDHSTAQKELAMLAKKQGATLPMQPDADHMAMKQSLMGMSGADFDSAYLKGQVIDHQAAVALFTDESANGSDMATKAYATKYLPKLKGHLAMLPGGKPEMEMGNMPMDSTKMTMDSVK